MRMHRLVGIAYWASLVFMLTWYSASVSTPPFKKKKGSEICRQLSIYNNKRARLDIPDTSQKKEIEHLRR